MLWPHPGSTSEPAAQTAYPYRQHQHPIALRAPGSVAPEPLLASCDHRPAPKPPAPSDTLLLTSTQGEGGSRLKSPTIPRNSPSNACTPTPVELQPGPSTAPCCFLGLIPHPPNSFSPTVPFPPISALSSFSPKTRGSLLLTGLPQPVPGIPLCRYKGPHAQDYPSDLDPSGHLGPSFLQTGSPKSPWPNPLPRCSPS